MLALARVRASSTRRLLPKARTLSTAPVPPVIEAPAVAPEAYSRLLSAMHWLVAPAFTGSIIAVLVAQEKKGKEKGVWMFRHKSLGLLSGLLIAPRMAARLTSKAPGMIEGNSTVQHMVGQASHALMYAFMLLMPATGIAMGYYGGKGLPFFWTTLPGGTANGDVAKQAFSIHKTVGTYGKFLVPLHIGGASLHFIKGQSIFARINPFR